MTKPILQRGASPEYTRITIGEIIEQQGEEMCMRLIAGEEGLKRHIDHPRLQKPSLAFAGFFENLNDFRLQVVGRTELKYLSTRPVEEQEKVVNSVFDLHLAAVVLTRGIDPPSILIDAAQRTGTPLIVTAFKSARFMTDMMQYLTHHMAPLTYQHGVYLDIFGLGVLLMGASGIGKSEIALELISRGHRLIADDMVELVRESPTVLVGRSPETLRYHIEVRGLGILNIRDLFGAAALTDTKRMGLIVQVVSLSQLSVEERLLNEEVNITLHGVAIPAVVLPIRSGRSLAVLTEVAVRNQLLKRRGIDGAKQFTNALEKRLQEGQTTP
ncbi:MAG: HPr(Ser) kinase/phosphatase [Mariprofundaceae bacterium]